MHAVTIHDIHKQEGFSRLAVDLIDILKLYEPLMAGSSWQCRQFWCIPQTGDEVRDESEEGFQMTGAEMLRWAGGWQQVIDGEFICTREGDLLPWLVVRAQDSSYYVVLAREDHCLDAVREFFRDVRPSPEWAADYD